MHTRRIESWMDKLVSKYMPLRLRVVRRSVSITCTGYMFVELTCRCAARTQCYGLFGTVRAWPHHKNYVFHVMKSLTHRCHQLTPKWLTSPLEVSGSVGLCISVLVCMIVQYGSWFAFSGVRPFGKMPAAGLANRSVRS